MSWARDRNGIRFAGRGIVYASELRPRSGLAETDSCSLEVWLQPEGLPERGGLVGFSGSGDSFSLFQERFTLGLRLYQQRNIASPWIYRHVRDVFHPGEPVLIAISSNGKTTNIFVNGALTQSIDFPLVARYLQSELQSRDWEGRLFGIATYGRALSLADVSRHREAWLNDGRPEPTPGADVLAMYLFDERGGRTIHNETRSGADLYIPPRYMERHRLLLKAERPKPSDWPDVLLNIAAFVPLGFLFCAYFSLGRSRMVSMLVTILTGFAISFGMEVIQSFLPDRNSDILDIATNTLGTVAGVLLCRIPCLSSGLAKHGAMLLD